ncbi:MAG: hypothetical protein WA705_03130 [Candidatus Ozemobacteraceae bacterium]
MPKLEKSLTWQKRGQTALNEASEENAKSFINRIQTLAKVWKFTLQETAQTGENPVYVNLSGIGNYKAAANILREIGKNGAIIINKLSLTVQDDLLVNTHCEMIVRTGPWQGNNTSKERIEPLQEPIQPLNLGNVDLFGREAPPEPQTINTPKIRYLGFYSGKIQPTGIIEEQLKSMLVQPGDRTPTGLRIESITSEFIVVRAAAVRGREWKIPLEKSH